MIDTLEFGAKRMEATDDRHWHKLGVPLSWLYELDDCAATNALADAFGDRYLYRHNAVYQRIRDAAIEFGYRFSSNDTPLWRDYQSFSLTTLHRILAKRTIPYLDTANTVRGLLSVNPKAALAPGFLIANLRSNHAFHESAHAVAHVVLERFERDLRRVAPDDRDRFVLEGVLAESYANTVERLASVFGSAQISDTLFYSLNSYVSPRTDRAKVLDSAGTAVGASMRFAILLVASFAANLTVGRPSDRDYERVASAVGCPSSQLECARHVTNVGYDLSSGFREDTTQVYFGMLGYRKQYLDLAGATWLDSPDHCRLAHDLAEALFEVTGA